MLPRWQVTGSSAERALKHATQEAAVAAHLQHVGLLGGRGFTSKCAAQAASERPPTPAGAEPTIANPRFTYVEFGAGAGGLAWACAQAAAAIHPNALGGDTSGVSARGGVSGSGGAHRAARAQRPNVVLVERLAFPPATDRRWLAQVPCKNVKPFRCTDISNMVATFYRVKLTPRTFYFATAPSQPHAGSGLAAAVASPRTAPGFLRCRLDIRDFCLAGVGIGRPDLDLRAAPPVKT